MTARIAMFIAFILVIAACSSTEPDAAAPSATTTQASSTAPSSTQAPTTTTTSQPTTTTGVQPTTTVETVTTTEPPQPPLSDVNGTYTIVWESVTNPFWDPNAGTADDPYFFIHTIPDLDGFFFSIEMYTTGYGALWQGELGDVEVMCNEGAPGPNSTGICPHFDPDGPGPTGDLAADFATTGSITINQLDADGYDILVNELVFSDGSTISGFQLVGP